VLPSIWSEPEEEYKQDLFWNNIPNFEKKLGYLEEYLVNQCFLKKLKNPYFIYTGNGKIKELESIVVDDINNLEIYFYLYEPSCFRIGEHNRNFYSEFKSDVDLKKLTVDEIESIKIFVKNNNIKNFRVFTSDYKIQLIQNNYPGIKLDCLDLFLREMGKCYKKFPKYFVKHNISKKFWCGNWRYTIHRHVITSYLSQLSGTYTWNLKCSWDELKNNDWFDLEKLQQERPTQYEQLKKGVDFLENNILAIDQKIDSLNVKQVDDVYIPGGHAPNWTPEFLKSYESNFCAVINETRYAQPFGYFSEKTLTAIGNNMPFILVAPPYSLEYLKTFGFQTFDRWWDESYDQETDHYNRLVKIFDIIDYINSKPLIELTNMYCEMKTVIKHNRKILDTVLLNDKIV
jgi:hypothetical protein